MARFGIIATLALVVSMALSSFGFHKFLNTGLELWAALNIVMWILVISSALILFLSFFAIKSQPDGSFVISEKSLYGKVFLFFLSIAREGLCVRYDSRTSFCSVFWMTNLTVVLLGFCFGLVAVAVSHALKYGFWASLIVAMKVVGIVVAVIGIIVLLFWLAFMISGSDTVRALEHSWFARFIKGILWVAVGTLLAEAGIVAVYLFGWAAIFASLWTVAKFILIFGLLVALVVAAIYGIYRLVTKTSGVLNETQFGKEFGSFYEIHLCPRINLKD